MVEAFDLFAATSHFFEQCVCPKNIRLQKDACPVDRSVDMRLGRKVYDHVDLVHRFLDRRDVSNIAVNERMPSSIDSVEVARIAGIGKSIQVRDMVVRVIGKPVPNKVRSDKSGASGYK